MKPNSASSITEQETSTQPLYVTSDKDALQSVWIQPSVSHQAYQHTEGALIDGIYVRISPTTELVSNHQLAADEFEAALDRMVADLELRREIEEIADDFASTELDGLADNQ